MSDKRLKSIIESLLFFWGDPLDIKSISQILNIDIKKTEDLINDLMEEYKSSQRGILIKKINKSYQLVTSPLNHEHIQKLIVVEDEKNLSDSAMETLSIIAYKQPVTRVEIESIRGVRSSSSINTLLSRGLIKEMGKLDKVGRPIIYGTTDEFLRVFGIEDITKLPKPKDLELLVKEKESE